MVTFKGAHFEATVILTCVRWYLAYPLRYRQLEEMMQERGVAVDHSTINRWVLQYPPGWQRSSVDGSDQWAPAGASTRPTSR